MTCKCSIHNRSIGRTDPTRTQVLRNRFSSDMANRFNQLIAVIRKSIIDEDCFGLNKEMKTFVLSNALMPAKKNQFEFGTNAEKVESFMGWLKEQQEAGVLELFKGPGKTTAGSKAWTSTYIQTAYQKGIAASQAELKKQGYIGKEDGKLGIRADMATSFNQPFHVDKVGLAYSRTFSELKGITDAMDKDVSKILGMGLADGKGPKALARELVATIDGKGAGTLGITDKLGRFIPAKRRAMLLARTEIIRAHHKAMIEEYRQYQVEGLIVDVEFATAGDDRVCPECDSLNGKIFTIEEIENLIPVHPQCRCKAIPIPKGVRDVEEEKKAAEPTETKAPGPEKVAAPEETVTPEKLKWEPLQAPAVPNLDDLRNYKKSFRAFGVDTVSFQDASVGVKKHKFADSVAYGNKIGEVMTGAFNDHPHLKEMVEKSKETIRLNMQPGALLYINGKKVNGFYQKFPEEITVPVHPATKKHLPKIGGWGISDSAEGTFLHEYSHWVQEKAILGKNVVTEWKAVLKAVGSDTIKKEVSEYAATNYQEAWAEAFSFYIDPSYKTAEKKLPKPIEDFFKRILKEDK